MNVRGYTFEQSLPVPEGEERWKAEYGEVSDEEERYVLGLDLLRIDAKWRYSVREDGTVIESSFPADFSTPEQAVDAAITWIGENYAGQERIGVCRCCGKVKDDVLVGLCSECETEEYTYCTLCTRHITLDEASNHRHVFETEHGEWYGTGGADMDERAYEEVRQSLFALLDRMGRRFARDLQRTIEHGHMCYDNLHTVTGLVVGPTIIFCYLDGGWRRKEKCFATHSYGDKLHSLLEAYESSQDKIPFLYGFWWLFGLGEGTRDANARTLGWISRWRAARSASAGNGELA